MGEGAGGGQRLGVVHGPHRCAQRIVHMSMAWAPAPAEGSARCLAGAAWFKLASLSSLTQKGRRPAGK